jgi:hypothetical protein
LRNVALAFIVTYIYNTVLEFLPNELVEVLVPVERGDSKKKED